MEEKYIGLTLAVISSLLIGTSFIITKKGLIANNSAGAGYSYLRNVTWWLGMILMVTGELANFAAYGFAPAILVTPLGALSVLTSAILASIFLGEELGRDGKLGSALSLIGSVIIILHAPEEHVVNSIDEMLMFAEQPGFIVYSLFVCCSTMFLIYYATPRWGRSNPLVYISICSLVGSITVIACKALGIAIKLTGEGKNQFKSPSTYTFMIIVGVCIAVQMNYFNKALDLFTTSVVTPVYYVFFTTATIIASVILFQGVADTTPGQFTSVLLGFATIFIGIFLINSKKHDIAQGNNGDEHELGRFTDLKNVSEDDFE